PGQAKRIAAARAQLRYAEVEHRRLWPTVPRASQKDIGRLEVAMDHALLMRDRHGAQHRQQDVESVSDWHRADPVDHGGQTLALEKRIPGLRDPTRVSAVGDADDVRMPHPRRGLAPAKERGASLRRRRDG